MVYDIGFSHIIYCIVGNFFFFFFEFSPTAWQFTTSILGKPLWIEDKCSWLADLLYPRSYWKIAQTFSRYIDSLWDSSPLKDILCVLWLKHVVVLHFVSGSPDSDHPETPEKEVGSSQRKPSTEWILQADSLACFGCIFFVAEFVAVVFQTRWKKDRNRSEPLRSVWQVCENLLTAGALWNRGPQTRSKSASTMG